MVFKRLCDPGSKLGVLRWLETMALPLDFGSYLALTFRAHLQQRCPHVSASDLAPAKVEQLDRRLVGVDDARAQHEHSNSKSYSGINCAPV